MKFNQRDKRVLGGCVGTGRLGTKGKEEEESAGSSTSQNRALSRHCPPPVVQVLNALPSLKGTTGPARVINIRASGVYIYMYIRAGIIFNLTSVTNDSPPRQSCQRREKKTRRDPSDGATHAPSARPSWNRPTGTGTGLVPVALYK